MTCLIQPAYQNSKSILIYKVALWHQFTTNQGVVTNIDLTSTTKGVVTNIRLLMEQKIT